MSIQECIDEYKRLSKIIFKKKQFLGKFSGGLYMSRYSGEVLRNCVRDLLKRRGLGEDDILIWNGNCNSRTMHWYVCSTFPFLRTH